MEDRASSAPLFDGLGKRRFMSGAVWVQFLH